jgi:ubiquinone/menaquinone biosynthesis C-methylase UbiE
MANQTEYNSNSDSPKGTKAPWETSQVNPQGPSLDSNLDQNPFEKRYQQEPEPWNYSERAVELIRHDRVVSWVSELLPKNKGSTSKVLEVGASLGLMSVKLSLLPLELTCLDVSKTALLKNKVRHENAGLPPPKFLVSSIEEIPLATEILDGVVLSDVIQGADFTPAQSRASFKEIYRILKPGGWVVITEYIHPREHAQYIKMVSESGFQIESVKYFGDRISFQLLNNLKLFKKTFLGRMVIQNYALNQGLCWVGQRLGPHFSKHLGLIVRKPV